LRPARPRLPAPQGRQRRRPRRRGHRRLRALAAGVAADPNDSPVRRAHDMLPSPLLWRRRPSPARPPRRLCRPRLEALEGRLAPAVFTVTTTLDAVAADRRLSLREAVSLANARPGADTIVLPAGAFKIALIGANEDGNATGDFDVTGPLTVVGRG